MSNDMKLSSNASGGANSFTDDDIVITGISGRFPLADDMQELKDNLYSKRYCIVRADDRWSSEIPGCPNNYLGRINDIDKFDSEFFNMNATAVNIEDPQIRIVNEVCYEAIVDSGYNPKELRNQPVGVFVGQSDSDSMALERTFRGIHVGKISVGVMACMAANKISFRYDLSDDEPLDVSVGTAEKLANIKSGFAKLKTFEYVRKMLRFSTGTKYCERIRDVKEEFLDSGPSLSVDTACSSSASAVEEAFRRLKQGTIDAAIVAGNSVCLDPRGIKPYQDLGILSPTGETRCYDEHANGFAVGEAVTVIFIQKKKDARRIYAKIHNVECMAADYHQGREFFPSADAQLSLYKSAYGTIGMDPTVVNYIEGYGASKPEADKTELNSIEEVFCKSRKTPLLLGTVKSNIGHTEAASALCNIAKIILAFETSEIPPTINCGNSNLRNGQIQLVTENTPCDKMMAAINSFGFGGSIAHIILESNGIQTRKDRQRTTDDVSKLVVYAATTEAALVRMFTYFNENSMPNEFFALLNKSAYVPPHLTSWRGFTILKSNEPAVTSIEHIFPVRRQVWYIITGTGGCQRPGMGLDLMKLEVFAKSMRRSAKTLESFGIDLLELLNRKNKSLQEEAQITPDFVTSIAIQIALVDVLKALDLEPDGIIGHSTGELVCSYADGCCTAEQTMLSAYYIAVSVESANLPPGAMATVGLSWEETRKRCPEGVFPACHDGEDSVTVSGSLEAVEKFVKQLKAENIFADIVSSHGNAFHCKNMSSATARIRSALQKVYTSIKPRSKRWLSTSYSEHEWNEPECELADANYYCHNLESEVHFREVLTHVPPDAIIIEIGQHFQLQSIVKKAIGGQASYIELLNKNGNNVDFLLSSIGKLYNLGLDPQVENLYESVPYPVPRGTPMVSPFIKWDHSKSFVVSKYQPGSVGGKTRFSVETISTEKFLLDHCIEGRSLYPATGYIYLAWKALGEILQKPMDKLPVCIENFKILRATILSSRDDKTFAVGILRNSGNFEICEGGSVVATGKIYVPQMPMLEDLNLQHELTESCVAISGADIYNELRIHGYEYGPAFQGLLEVNMEGTHGLVKWNNEWISFLDSLLLFFGIIFENSDFKLPTGALSFKIDPNVLMNFITSIKEKDIKGVPVRYDRHARKCVTPGVEIRNLKLELAPHRSMSDIVPLLEEYSFVPYDETRDLFGSEKTFKYETYLLVCNHLAKQVAHNLKIGGKVQSMLEDIEFNDKDQESYFNQDENCCLLESLRNVLEMSLSPKLTMKIQEKSQNLSDILFQDMLFKSMLSERPLRTLLDVAAENCLGKMTITELCDSSSVVLTAVQEIMKSSTLTKTNYILMHSNTTLIDTESLSQKGIQVESVEEKGTIPSNFKASSHLGVTCCMSESSNSFKSRIRNIASLTKEEGFILVIHKHELTPAELLMRKLSKLSFTLHSEDEMEGVFQEENLPVVSKKSSSFGINAYLLRKIPEKFPPPDVHVVKVQETEHDGWVEDLKRALSTVQERGNSGVVLLVAQDTVTNGIIGLVNCLKQEPGGDKIRCIFTDTSAPHFDLRNSFYREILKKNLLINIYMNGTWGSLRHTALPTSTPTDLVDCAYVECKKLGDLSSLLWLESPIKCTATEDGTNDLYHVYYSSLNFRDVMVATGKLSALSHSASGHRTDAFVIGIEFSGRDKIGRRVMAIVGGGSICNTYKEAPLFVMDIPDKWSLEEAATVPVVYATCYYALILKGELQHGEKILIHSGTGGVGQAAIRIALSMGCEIFTTVGTPEKREFLKKTFPQLKPENIGCSRDTTFEKIVLRQTKGEGVDVVLNSLADDKFQASIRCLGFNGRFLEIGKYDLQLDNALELQVFLKGISFIACQMDTYFLRTQKSKDLFAKITALLKDGIQRGVVQPLDTTVFHRDEIEKAFRYMGSGKHVGKVLIKVREEESEKTVVPSIMTLKANKNFGLYSTKSYIIIGGLGGFGIELAKWLVKKGAGTVILTSRYGARTPYHHFCLKRWEASGARVFVSTLDVSKRDEAQKLLEEASTLYGPIGGIFNSAVVLKDAFIENQSVSSFEDVCAPKALATKYLDELTRTMCPDLDMFVCFSSISCGKGNAGQTNYGYANSVMERICEKRKQDGLHGLAIQWGIIGDVGLVHRRMGDDAMIAGVMAQKINSCLQCLEKFLLQDKAVVSSFVTADKSRMKKSSDGILGQISMIFGAADIEEMNPYRTLGEMGIDSMIGVELRHLLQSSFEMEFTLQQIQELKIDDIKKLVEDRDKNTKSSLLSQTQNIESINFDDQLVSLPTEPVVTMNRAGSGEPLFVIHGNDLLHGKLKKLYEGISRPVFALQSTKDTPIDSLKDMSLWYLAQIQRIFPDASVHLVSVSSSGNLALEMAFQSEKQKGQLPHIKSLAILDGSLDLMKSHSNTKQEKQQNAAMYEACDLCEFLSVFSDSDLTQLKTQLELLPSLESRVNMISNLLTSSHKTSISSAAEFYAKKQNLLRFHLPSGRLQMDLTVIEPAEKVLPNDVSAVKSFMEQMCDGRVTIHRVVGNHNFLAEDTSSQEVATILNKWVNCRNTNNNAHVKNNTVDSTFTM